MKRIALCLTTAILVFQGSLVCSAAKDRITWLQPLLLPYVIQEGDYAGKGIDEFVVSYFTKKMPGYDHKRNICNVFRALNELKEGKSVVMTTLLKTAERDKYVLYSDIPIYLVFPNGLVVRKADREKIGPFLLPDGTVNAEAVILSRKFTIGISKGRSYFGILDEMIRKYPASFYERTATEQSAGMLKMLDTHRMDATFLLPPEIIMVPQKEVSAENFLFFPVSGMLPYMEVYVAVPDNKRGKTVIQKINALIKEKGVISLFLEYYMSLLDEDTRMKYRNVAKKYYSQYDFVFGNSE